MSLAETAPEQRIAAPTQVLWPEHDPLFPRAWGDRLDEFFEDVTRHRPPRRRPLLAARGARRLGV